MQENVIAGLDEVGYGALAGPYVSVVAVFRKKDLTFLPAGVNDSKKLSPLMMETLYEPLCAATYDYGLGTAWPWEIDMIGPNAALQKCYARALQDLSIGQPDVLYVDGIRQVASWKGYQIVEPKADAKYLCVSAASIIAKVWRDRYMVELGKKVPHYEFDVNKGYGTKTHEEAIRRYGLRIEKSTEPWNNSPEKYVHRERYCRKFLFK